MEVVADIDFAGGYGANSRATLCQYSPGVTRSVVKFSVGDSPVLAAVAAESFGWTVILDRIQQMPADSECVRLPFLTHAIQLSPIPFASRYRLITLRTAVSFTLRRIRKRWQIPLY